MLNIQNHNTLRNYIKKGTIKENAIDELYRLTTNKLDDKYRDKLSILLYNGRKVKNYFTKRVNLDKVVYNFNPEEKLYITLSNFKNKKNASSQDQIKKYNKYSHHYIENKNNYLTLDNNSSHNKQLHKNKNKLSSKDLLGSGEESLLNRNIKHLLLNEDLEISKKFQDQIWAQLSQKYNFMKDDEKLIKNYSNKFNNKIRESPIRKSFSISKKNDDNDNIKLIKEKTYELNRLKTNNYKNYLSPIFFLGKSRDKFLHKVSYAHNKKFIKEIDKKIEPLKEWFNSDDAIKTYNEALFNEVWNKYASGTPEAWSMEALTYYDGDHELKNTPEDIYGIVNYYELPEEPVAYEFYTRYIDGKPKAVPKYNISRIAGTVVQADNNHHSVALLTTHGLVNIKFSKGHYAFYNKRISQVNENGKKTTIEDSWLKRGNKLLVSGYRRGEQFIPWIYNDTIYKHRINLIEHINEDGTLELKAERAKV